jgi:hypothetical protein
MSELSGMALWFSGGLFGILRTGGHDLFPDRKTLSYLYEIIFKSISAH